MVARKPATCSLAVMARGLPCVNNCFRKLRRNTQAMWLGAVSLRRMLCPPHCLKPFSTSFTFFQMPRSHILCYAIPGADGSITKGKRRLNWVWYWNYREADELSALLTDRTGRKRRTSVPPGMVCAEHWQKQMDIARVSPAAVPRIAGGDP